jgi:hypothetical protein
LCFQAAPNLPAISAGQGAAHPLWEILDRKSKIDPLSDKGANESGPQFTTSLLSSRCTRVKCPRID